MNRLYVGIIGIVVLLLIFLAFYCSGKKCKKDKFVTKKALDIHSEAKDVFDKTEGKATFSAYKVSVTDADVVQYKDLKDLWRKGALTPENVQKSI